VALSDWVVVGAWDCAGNLIAGAVVAGGVVWACAHADALMTRAATNGAPRMRNFMALPHALVRRIDSVVHRKPWSTQAAKITQEAGAVPPFLREGAPIISVQFDSDDLAELFRQAFQGSSGDQP
jgi:hypothetical protein